MSKVIDYSSELITDLANQASLEPISFLKRMQENPNAIIDLFKIGLIGCLGSSNLTYKDEFYDAKSEVAFSLTILIGRTEILS